MPQRFISQKHNTFTEEVNEIPLSANDNEKIQWIRLIACRTGKDLVCRNEMKHYNKTVQKITNFDDLTKEHKR